MINLNKKILSLIVIFFLFISNKSFSEEQNISQILETIQKDLKTLEKAVYSSSNSDNLNSTIEFDQNAEDVLTRHLLKLSELENQFNIVTNKFEEVNYKLDKLSSRLSKIQSDNQLRFQELEEKYLSVTNENRELVSKPMNEKNKILPGSSEPQDLGAISYKDTSTNEVVQQTQSVDTTSVVVAEEIESEEKILPNEKPEKQYEFAQSFLRVGDYNTAERAFLEFVKLNSDHDLAGNAQYWYAETFRIRQLYTDAASAYLEGYQKYPKSEKAAINLLKLGVSLVQIGEKDQGCLMIKGVKKEYPKAKQSVLQKAKYEEKKFDCQKQS